MANEVKERITVKLTSWQLAQCERLVEDSIGQLKRDGLRDHAVTRSMEALLEALGAAR